MSQSIDRDREDSGPGTLPESNPQHFKSGPSDAHAQNPYFQPGYSALRLEQVQHMHSDADRTKLINSLADDIVTTFLAVRSYHDKGILSDDNILQIDAVLKTIGHNNQKAQERLERKLGRLKLRHRQLQRDYVHLARGMDAMGTKYAARIASLENRVHALKTQLQGVKSGGLLRQSRSRRATRFDRMSVSGSSTRNEKKEDPELAATKSGKKEAGEGNENNVLP
ncbi:hypothetical protein PDE_08097 [Penicillium oxalicum 114-2]|uniref:Uncharacterized protein n=1 Tax=Penicillium oxalicum (strain 114-2 / CGMCC 5302) TaxID=933388 RepID=S7ZQX9_PENO1|nr:hypothetical protein PDE_08097 [Penicillium oxalicum 114-2]